MGLFRKKETVDPQFIELYREYQNYRRRTEAELERAYAKAAKETVLPFLDVYDDLERALAMPCKDERYYKGIQLIYENLMITFKYLNIVPMDSKGKIFNPTYHEAVQRIRDENLRAEEIADVILTGFLMDDEVLRHAKVVVANCE